MLEEDVTFTDVSETEIKSLTCVSPLVDLQVFRSSKYFSTAGERTWEWFLSGVHSDMIYQFVLGFKWLSFSGTLFPEADMVSHLRATDVINRHMRYQLVHRAVSFGAEFFRRVFRFVPLAD